MRKLEDGRWELEFVAGREEVRATAIHSAVVLADIMTVRSGACSASAAGSLKSTVGVRSGRKVIRPWLFRGGFTGA